ncbi:MAG: hypothetical protein FJX76_01510 [Armatimonadetes bacterium]|nr:hypothetical protein [Armatimonadota bacterium]MBM3738933.1 hypothetical protein [Acidobacteriota bacterium]
MNEPLWLRILTTVLVFTIAVIALLLLTSCAAVDKFAGICVLHPIGQTQQGQAAFVTYCERRD